MDAILPFGLTTVDAVTIFSGVAAFMLVVAMWNALTVRDPMRGRVKSLQSRREELRAGFVAPQRRTSSIRKRSQTDEVRKVFEKLKLMRKEQSEKIQQQLVRAGWRSRDAEVVYLSAKLGSPVVIGFAAIMLFLVMNILDLGTAKRFLVTAGTIIFGFMLPDILVKNAIQKRVEAIRLGLPDALDLMVICAEAGLTLDSAFQRVAKELGSAYPELGDEFNLTSIELGFLQERRQALENLVERVDLPGVKSFVTTLIQTEKYGTPLASSLRVLSGEFRNERMMKAEEKAARLPAIMTVPLILFILPCLFIVLMGPAACKISDEFLNR
ncbi:MAG: type II secretion system F family protein [Sphingomonadales bacterium]|jgi:tight adherence protein C